jgi:hypothetical protein
MRTRKIKAVVAKKPMREPDKDILFWRNQPYQDRLAALEEIRLEFHHWKDDVQPGLQRVYRIIKRQPG